MNKSNFVLQLFRPIRRRSVFYVHSKLKEKIKKHQKQDIYPKNREFYIVVKPLKRKIAIHKYMRQASIKFNLHDYRIMKIDHMGEHMPLIYRNNSQLSQEVAELYRTDIGLSTNTGYIVICKATEYVDLILLKRFMRKKIGYRFYEITNLFSGSKTFVGLNGIHIPDGDVMSTEGILLEKIAFGYSNNNSK